ncbi:MAG: orotidine-5'-phosphate decarboxylase [Tractidigestivibacter sp.]|jgi:orotidine-5'-phosphate decarboxylase|uniref:orotidine-5'-phosphate decarboxylase n=1 Tax=Tractidigestivibacter sp. TaxID=2847320 RepID=UPI003D8F3A86
MLTESEARDAIIVALDCDRDRAMELADTLSGKAKWVKIGMTLFYLEGPSIVREMHERGLNVFLDLKVFDIPFQVRGAVESASLTGADILSIHGLGSSAMVAAAREGAEAAAEKTGRDRTRLVAISVLTSMDQDTLGEIGITCPLSEEVSRLASLAVGAGSDGIVCSPKEAADMRALLGPDALIVTPGVRPAGAAVGDQKRVATPAAAIAAGASKLVIGRPITQAQNPAAAFKAIVQEIAAD